jgi:hypothetical protein
MTDLEIIDKLNYMKEVKHYMHGNPGKGFLVTLYKVDSAKPNISITTTLERIEAISKKNFPALIETWKEKPTVPTIPAVAVTKPAEIDKNKDGVKPVQPLSGDSAKYPHVTSEVKVYVTREYKIFKHATGNRMLNRNKIKKIVHDIQHGLNRLMDYPISVDGTMRVLDGQHRLEAAIQTKENIYYIIARPMEMHQVARVNSNTERWKGADFINCYVSQDSDHYKVLKAFIEKYGFPITQSIKMLEGNSSHAGGEEAIRRFEQGKFATNEKFIAKAESLAQTIMLFKDFPSHKSGNFIGAIESIKNKGLCDWDHLIEKFKKRPDMLKTSSNKKQYITDLELIYNLNAQKRTIII